MNRSLDRCTRTESERFWWGQSPAARERWGKRITAHWWTLGWSGLDRRWSEEAAPRRSIRARKCVVCLRINFKGLCVQDCKDHKIYRILQLPSHDLHAQQHAAPFAQRPSPEASLQCNCWWQEAWERRTQQSSLLLASLINLIQKYV